MSATKQQNRPTEDILRLIGETGEVPKQEDMRLLRNRESLRMTIMQQAWRDAGIDIENPGRWKQYYFENSGFVLIDLNGEISDE